MSDDVNDNLNLDCSGYDAEGMPMRDSPWASKVNSGKCKFCKRRCPLDIEKIETLERTIASLRRELDCKDGKVVFERKNISGYKDYYESVWFPRLGRFHMMSREEYRMSNEDGKESNEEFPWWWKFKLLNWAYRLWDSLDEWLFSGYLFNRYNWMRNCTPGFIEPMGRLWNNAQIFCTPWYRTRRKFKSGFANMNDSKLLSDGPDYVHIRNRQADCVYYTLKFFGFHYNLIKTVWRDSDGRAANTFISGILIAFDSSKTDEEKRKAAKAIKEESEVIRSGWVFSLDDAIRELNEIVRITPDLEWFRWDQDDDEEEKEEEAKENDEKSDSDDSVNDDGQ